MSLNVLGISCFYHDSAACLIQGGQIVAAAHEERFTRRKGEMGFPINSVDFCLSAAGLTIFDLDYIAFYEKPFLKFSRLLISYLRSYPFAAKRFLDTIPAWLGDRLAFPFLCKKRLNFLGKTVFIPHHLSHAASAFLVSPFEEAAILTVDGVGEWATACFGTGKGNDIRILKELRFPNSLGLFYSAITTYLGFRALTGEGKVMALAAYGNPSYLKELKKIINVRKDGSFNLDSSFFDFNRGARMYSQKFVKIFGKERKAQDKLEERHFDMAASAQIFLEETLIAIASNVHKETKSDRLCLAGGVFLNCVANSKILEATPFREVFIQPAAGDSGGALGAAAYVCHSFLKRPRGYPLKHACLGPEFSSLQIKVFLQKKNISFKEMDFSQLVKFAANELSRGKIIGWFQGRMEWGMRALGQRSILASPLDPRMMKILNEEVKHRESFRPYGVSVLEEEAHNYFDLKSTSPFMLLVGRVRNDKKDSIPSAIHIDGTSRVQTLTKEDNGIFYELVEEFRKITGVPMVINTSFNDKDEPIICAPAEACRYFFDTPRMDYLVMGNCLIEKNNRK